MKYLKLFEDYTIDIAISKIQELNFLDSEDEPIDPIKKQMAIQFVRNQFELHSIVPFFIAPTVYQGVLIEYKHDDIRIDIRFEDSDDDFKEMIVVKSNKSLYNGVYNEEIFDSYLNLS